MPAEFQWKHEQTQDHITFLVNIRGKSSKTIDVFVADLLVKISQPHGFLLILDTLEAIVPTETRIENDGNALKIRAKKAVSKHWDTILFEAKKEEIKIRRQQSILRREREISQLHEDARSRRVEEERTTLKHQIGIEKREQARIEELKRVEKEHAENKVYQQLAEIGQGQNQSTNLSNDYLPPVRQMAVINFQHSPRFFKTPARESTVLQERVFIAKNRPFLKANKYFNTDSSTISDSDPTWLKARGDEFFKNGDYLAAINAYSECIEKDDSIIKAFMNRSLCFIMIEEPDLCIVDCDKVLERLKATVDQSSFTKVLKRKVSALCYKGGLENLQKALGVMQKVLDELGPDATLTKEIAGLEASIEARIMKRKGDEAFSNRDFNTSLTNYGKAIEKESNLLEAFTNRSAVFLIMGDFHKCIKDCTHVLETLRNNEGRLSDSNFSLLSNIPSRGSESRLALVKACLGRSIVAKECANLFEESSKEKELYVELFGLEEKESS
ncbi:hypothetical protein CTEN210_10561 [Chaetoceros tenuissimus]|uniref:Dynein assembly factor 4, axonemal n=1 Tax=Chaetoceros tenuissimus TaxID=426638 RepID=A0AAD3D030_9STRA|nr:hypothetical protein CTEN210_10561 [Chaetoceros tenuissimus]